MRYADEIKKILRGFSRQEDGVYVAANNILDVQYYGSYNGADALRLRGLYCMRRRYMIPGKIAPTLQTCVQQLYRIGSPAMIAQNPDAACCLCLRAMGNPAFLMLELREKVLILTVYTAKSLFAKHICKSTIKSYDSHLTEILTPIGDSERVTNATEKKEAREQSKPKKQTKKEKKKETRKNKANDSKRSEEKADRSEAERTDSQNRAVVQSAAVQQTAASHAPQEPPHPPVTSYRPSEPPVVAEETEEGPEFDMEEYMENYIRENH